MPSLFIGPVRQASKMLGRLKHFGDLTRHLNTARSERQLRHLQMPSFIHIHLLLPKQTHLLFKLIEVLRNIVFFLVHEHRVASHLHLLANDHLLAVQWTLSFIISNSRFNILLLNGDCLVVTVDLGGHRTIRLIILNVVDLAEVALCQVLVVHRRSVAALALLELVLFGSALHRPIVLVVVLVDAPAGVVAHVFHIRG